MTKDEMKQALLSGTAPEPLWTRNDAAAAMKDERYSTDSNYRAEVATRIAYGDVAREMFAEIEQAERAQAQPAAVITPPASQVQPLRSPAELSAAMQDPRYRTDPAYRDDVAKRIEAGDAAGYRLY